MANKAQTKKQVKKEEPKQQFSFIPDYDSVLVEEVLDQERISAGGIVIPESVEDQDEDVRHGIIINVGPSSNPNRPFLHAVGDLIVFGYYNGRNVKFNGKELRIVRHLDILGSIK
jgi:chaperonin GroES